MSTDWLMDKVMVLYTIKYYSPIKKNEIMPLSATLMDLEIIILSEASQTKKNIIYHLYVESKKEWYEWIYFKKIEIDSQTQ